MLRRLSGPGDVVLDFCAGKCSTTKACKLLDQRSSFARGSTDYQLLTAAKANLVLTFTSQALNLKLDLSGSAEAIAAEELFRDKRSAFFVSKICRVCKVPYGSDALEMLLGHSLHFILALFVNYLLCEMCRHRPLSLWSLVRQSRLYSTDPESLLANECGRL